jgi:hypothetical protein
MDRTKRSTSSAVGREGHTNRPLLQRAKHRSIWHACREAQQAAISRAAQESERLKAAALELGFTKNKAGVWSVKCPNCGYPVQLYTQSGYVRAISPNPRCAVVTKLQAHLRNGGLE